MSYSDDLGDRVIRAMAALHFGLDEAANGYTATDMEMISRGFVVWRTSENLPVWTANGPSHFVAVSQHPGGGLPSTMGDPAVLVFGVPDGHQVTVFADNLTAALHMLDSGKLPAMLNPNANVEVHGAFLPGQVTLH